MRSGGRILLFSVICFVLPTVSFAQNEYGGDSGSKSYAYFNLYGSSVRKEGFNLESRSLGFDTENYFNGTKLFLFSGWGWGYRHEPSDIGSRGHFFNAKTFKTFNGPFGVNPKFDFGVEVGYPTTNYDSSKFYVSDGVVSRYEIIFLERNWHIPKTATHLNGVAYPFAGASIFKLVGRFNFEAGVRYQFTRFHMDEYDFVNNIGTSRKERLPTKSVFIRIGIRTA